MNSSYFILRVNVIDCFNQIMLQCHDLLLLTSWWSADRVLLSLFSSGLGMRLGMILFMCHNILSFYQNTSMIITLICCRCVAMWKEGEESSTAHTYNYMYKCTHTHTIFTHHTSSHDGLHQTWNNRVMSSMHKQCTRGEFFLSCSYVSITMVKEVSWWDYWSQLTALTEESFSR